MLSERWIVSVHDISDHIEGAPDAHLALIYDPRSDWLVAGEVGSSVDEAVALVFQRLDDPQGREPRTLACDPRVIAAVRLQCSVFTWAPSVAAAGNADLLAIAAVFQNFLNNGPPAAAHDSALRALDAPARSFIKSECWKERADSEPLLLDARINGERVGGILSVMGNGGATWGISVFPNGEAFNHMMEREEPGMPMNGVLSCVVDAAALVDPALSAVEMAIVIEEGEAMPARYEQVRLLHVALVAASNAPLLGSPAPSTGEVRTPDWDAAFTVFDIEGSQLALEAERRAAATWSKDKGAHKRRGR